MCAIGVTIKIVQLLKFTALRVSQSETACSDCLSDNTPNTAAGEEREKSEFGGRFRGIYWVYAGFSLR